jgi:hypothetical protein
MVLILPGHLYQSNEFMKNFTITLVFIILQFNIVKAKDALTDVSTTSVVVNKLEESLKKQDIRGVNSINVEEQFILTPHQATYDIVFDPQKNNELGVQGIRDIQGNMTIKLIDATDGWIFEQHMVMFIYYDNDETCEQIRTTIVTWESKNGEHYDFKLRTVRNDEEEVVSGKAYAPKNLIGFVQINKPESIKFDLPKGTIFPLTYLSQIIKSALKGDLVAPTRPIFDVSNESLEPIDAMASISKVFDPGIKSSNSFKGSDKAWEVRYTIFTSGSKEINEDDFEMKQTILSNGVITGMTLDLGNANTKVVLKKVEFFSKDDEKTIPPLSTPLLTNNPSSRIK